MLDRSYSHAKLIWTWHGSMLTDFLLAFCCSCCLISVYLMLPVIQPCQVDLDMAWLDVNRNFICVFCCVVLIRNLRLFNARPVVQPCQVDLDLAWLDVNRNFACMFQCTCLISVYLMLPVVQPCQVDLDLAWLDVNRFFACVSP